MIQPTDIRTRILRMHRALSRIRKERRTTARFTSHFHTSQTPCVTSMGDTLYRAALEQ